MPSCLMPCTCLCTHACSETPRWAGMGGMAKGHARILGNRRRRLHSLRQRPFHLKLLAGGWVRACHRGQDVFGTGHGAVPAFHRARGRCGSHARSPGERLMRRCRVGSHHPYSPATTLHCSATWRNSRALRLQHGDSIHDKRLSGQRGSLDINKKSKAVS